MVADQDGTDTEDQRSSQAVPSFLTACQPNTTDLRSDDIPAPFVEGGSRQNVVVGPATWWRCDFVDNLVDFGFLIPDLEESER